MAGEYIVPIGADLKPLIDQLTAGQKAVSGLNQEAQKATDEMDNAFRELANNSAVLAKSLELNTAVNKKLTEALFQATQAGEQGNEQKREQIKLESQLLKELEKAVTASKNQLATLKEGSKEYNKLAKEISAAEVGLRTLAKGGDDANSKLERLRKTFNENRVVLQNLAAQGLTNTKVYKDLERQTGELADTIGDVNEAIKLAGSDTRALDNLIGSAQAITGAFTVAQGAVALFGDENENLQKALLKVNAALSILNGLQAIQAELKRKDSLVSRAAAAAQGAYAAVVGTSTGALKAFRVALAATGIGLIVIAIGALIANFDKIKTKVLELFPGLSTLADLFGRAFDAVTDFIGITSEAERALDALGKATEARNKKLENAIKILEAQGGKEKEIYEIKKAQIQGEINLLNERERVVGKLTDEELQQRQDLASDLAALNFTERNRIANDLKDRQQKADAAAEQRERKEKEAAAKLEAIRKDQAERILAFDKQFRDLKIAAIEDDFEREKALEEARFQDAVAAANKTVAEFQGTEEQRKAIQAAANKVIEQESLRHYANLTKIETDYRLKRLAVIQGANALANDVFRSELDRELAGINEKYAQSIKDLETILKTGVDPEALNALNNTLLARTVETLRAQQNARQKAADENSKSLKKQEQEYQSFSQRIAGFFTNAFQNAGLSQAEAEAAFGNITRVFQGLKASFEATIQAQIEGKQRQVEALNQQINEAEQALNRELELQKAGYANNVGAKQQEIEELKALRDKQLADEKRLRVEQAKLQSLEIAQATIAQTVDLASAAAKIFKAHAGIPFVGIALAGAAVAAMFTGFLAIRNKIKAAQDAVPKFRKGDKLDIDALRGASSHESGGVKMVDNNSGRVLAELEGNEKLFVINKNSSDEYEDALRAINNNDAMGAIQSLLKEVGGIHTIENAPKKTLPNARKADDARIKRDAALSGLATDGKLNELIQTVQSFKSQQYERPVIIQHPDGSVEIREGNYRKKIQK